jgi:plasmid stabilization system protein ParE
VTGVPVLVSREAETQIGAIHAWWLFNRPHSPDLFAQELAAAFDTIANAPELGRRYPHPEVEGVRRVALRATRNHVYYVFDQDAVVVLAVWSAVRGSGPDLRSLSY